MILFYSAKLLSLIIANCMYIVHTTVTTNSNTFQSLQQTAAAVKLHNTQISDNKDVQCYQQMLKSPGFFSFTYSSFSLMDTVSQSLAIIQLLIIHCESKKTCHQTFVYIFTKYRPILRILSLTYSVVNLQ